MKNEQHYTAKALALARRYGEISEIYTHLLCTPEELRKNLVTDYKPKAEKLIEKIPGNIRDKLPIIRSLEALLSN